MLLSKFRIAEISFAAAAACVMLTASPSFAHHGPFYKAVFRAIEKADLGSIKDLFSEAAWEGKEGAVSAAELQKRLDNADLIPRDKSQALRLYEQSSQGKDRSKCLVFFKLAHRGEEGRVEMIYLLAKRVDFSDETNSNRKAWQIVRIVNDQKEAERFLGRKL
jgi:hypothetical protein